MRRNGNRGEGAFGLIVGLAILFVAAVALVRIVPLHIHGNEVLDAMNEAANFAGLKPLEKLRMDVYLKAQDAKVPLQLQDIHVDDGAVTYTGYGNYPALDPGANYVVTIGMVSSAYPNTNHELIASNDGQQASMRYTLGPGTCGDPAPTPTAQPAPPNPPGPPKPSSSVDYQPGQCTITTKGNTPYYEYPLGQLQGTIGDETFDAVKGEKVNGDRWYMVFLHQDSPDAPVWVREQDIKNLPSKCKKF